MTRVERHDIDGRTRVHVNGASCGLQIARTDRSQLAAARKVDLHALARRAVSGEVIDEIDRRLMIALTTRHAVNYADVRTSDVELGSSLLRRLGVPEDNTAQLAQQRETERRAEELTRAKYTNGRLRRGFTAPVFADSEDE